MTEDTEWRDTMMVGILKRGLLGGDERHVFTGMLLHQRNPEAYERLMARAKREIEIENGGAQA